MKLAKLTTIVGLLDAIESGLKIFQPTQVKDIAYDPMGYVNIRQTAPRMMLPRRTT